MSWKTGWQVLKQSFNEFSEHRVLRLAAATAYYAVFSIGPLLVLIVGLAGLLFGEQRVQREVHQQAQSLVGEKSASLLGSMMGAQKTGASLMATIIGAVGLVLGASGVFGQLQDSLNTIWGVATKPGVGVWALLRDRLFSVATVLGIGFLLIVSMALSVVVNAFSGYIGAMLALPPWVGRALNEVVSLFLISVLFGLIFKVLPDVRLRWRSVWIGALGTGLLFTAGKFLLGWYLGRESGASAYGAGSSFVVILLYVYYSSVILYLGAEFTQAYARRLGEVIQPSKYAVNLTDAQRATQGIPRQEQLEHAVAEPAPAMRRTEQPKPAAAASVQRQDLAQAAHAETVKEEFMMSEKRKETTGVNVSPAERVRARPWAFVGMALVGGLVTGMMWKVKGLRRAIGTFSTIASSAFKEGRGNL